MASKTAVATKSQVARSSSRPVISLQALIGKGYADFWHFRGRYRVVRGSRSSKKSKDTAIYFIKHIMHFPLANLLVVRLVFETLRDSCYAEL